MRSAFGVETLGVVHRAFDEVCPVLRLGPVHSFAALQRIEQDEVGVRGRNLGNDPVRHKETLLVFGPCAQKRRAVVMVAHRERQRDSGFRKRLEERSRKTEILIPTARSRKVAQHDGIRRQRPEREYLLHELRQNNARLRRAVLPAHRVVQQMNVCQKRDEIRIMPFHLSAHACKRGDGRARASQKASTRKFHL